jgi:hypothetical protein
MVLIMSLSCTADKPFAAGVELRPSGLATAHAPKVAVPLCLLASEDEDAEAVKAFGEALTVQKLVERYEGAPHVSKPCGNDADEDILLICDCRDG